jgi:hypothetical protein
MMTDREEFEKWWLTKFSAEFLDSDNCWSAWTGWQARGDLDVVRNACIKALEPTVAELNDEYLRDTHVEGMPKEWQSLTHEEFVAIAKSIWGDNLGMGDGYGYTVAWASSYATIEPSSKMLLLYRKIDEALREKNNG